MRQREMREIGFLQLEGLPLRDNPARDACFAIVNSDAEMQEQEVGAALFVRELVHRHMSNEVTSLDIAAACLAEFPDAPWELRMELARQCWDETRHVDVLHRRLRELGGRKGEFPISTFEWAVTSAIDNLPGRLASQNRTFEAGAMDVVGGLVRGVSALGDEETAALLDGILADEVQHVRFANRWIKRFAEQDPRTLLKVAMAVRFVAEANARLGAKGAVVNSAGTALLAPEQRVPAVNVEHRRMAEFSEDEIHDILRQAGFRALLPETP